MGMLLYFGMQCCYLLEDGFLLVIIKKLYLCLIVYELLWFLLGDMNICYLQENGVSIWDEWVDVQGDLGLVYGYQWCYFLILCEVDGCVVVGEVDQIVQLIDCICKMFDFCRLIVLVWNFGEVDQMVLFFCYMLWQVCIQKGKLYLQFYQCLVDMFLGVFFNIVFYVLLMYMLVYVIGYEVGDFIYIMGDVYIYLNYLDQVQMQLFCVFCLLFWLWIVWQVDLIFDFCFEDFEFLDYDFVFVIKVLVVV